MDHLNYKRVSAVTHLRAAIMHIEAAMQIDSGTWDYVDVQDCRDGRDTVKNLVDSLDVPVVDGVLPKVK